MRGLHLIALLILPVLLSCATPAHADPVRPGSEHCVVNTRGEDPLNIRAAPSSTAIARATLNYATCGVIVTAKCVGNWCPVETGHYAGWVHHHYVAAVSAHEQCLSPKAESTLRAWPSKRSRTVIRLRRGMCGLVLLPYELDGWQKVRAGGWEGWLPSASVR